MFRPPPRSTPTDPLFPYTPLVRSRRDIAVTVSNLDKLGDFVLRATKVGINHVSTPILESSQADALSKQALAKAASDARDKAKLLADTLGMKLGPVRTDPKSTPLNSSHYCASRLPLYA